jgi:hydrogenase maturation protease
LLLSGGVNNQAHVGPGGTPGPTAETGGAAASRRPRTLVVGMGNPILSDDAVGIMLAQRISAKLAEHEDVDVIEECCVGGLNLMDLMSGYDRLIALDSIKTVDGIPGTWYAFDGTALRETMNLRNVHDANFATSLALGRQMGTHLPSDEECHIVAVEIADNMTFSEELTPKLQEAFPRLVAEIEAHVLAILESVS